MTRRADVMAALGFLGGLTAGVLLAGQQLHMHRRNLFSRRPYQRLAALSHLRSQPTLDNARLLQDYVRWEPRPMLRRRAIRILRQMEHELN